MTFGFALLLNIDMQHEHGMPPFLAVLLAVHERMFTVAFFACRLAKPLGASLWSERLGLYLTMTGVVLRSRFEDRRTVRRCQ